MAKHKDSESELDDLLQDINIEALQPIFNPPPHPKGTVH
jgi:hypothetical protein